MKWGSSCGNQSLVRRNLDWKNSATSPCGLTHMLVNLEHVLGSWSAAPSSSAVWLRHPVPFPLLCTWRCLCIPECRGKTQNHSQWSQLKRSALGSSGIDWSYTRRPYLGLFCSQVPQTATCIHAHLQFHASIHGFAVLLFYGDPSHVIPSNAKVKLIYFGV